jgi:methionyl aminopeptidase
MTIDTDEQFEGMKKIGAIVANTWVVMQKAARAGMSTLELDEIGEKYLKEQGAQSAPRLTYDFPGGTCISIEHEGAHGVPNADKILQDGDLINIDVSAELEGFYGDTGGSFVIGTQHADKVKLCQTTKEAMETGVSKVSDGVLFNRVGKAVEKVAQRNGYSVIRNLGGHGVGSALHEEPSFIAGHFDKRDKRSFKKNWVITIEPFLSTGALELFEQEDGWTLHDPAHYTAQFEHTLMVTDKEPVIFTLPTIN